MVNDEIVLKKKKKAKKRLSQLDGEDEPTPIKKKKKTTNKAGGESVKKKKRKKKKLLKNSTLLLDQSTNAGQMEEEANDSSEELFGSQSPIPTSGVPFQSPPPLSKHVPLDYHNGTDGGDGQKLLEGVSEEKIMIRNSPVKNKSPLKKNLVKTTSDRPEPVMMFKKKNADDVEEAVPAEDSDSDDVGSDDELHELPASGEAALALLPHKAPLSQPLISRHEQDQRDLLLLHQISEKFPDKTSTDEINWNDIFCFNMSPADMSARFEFLLNDIPRQKDFKTLVIEAKTAFCNARIREIPLSKSKSPYNNMRSSGSASKRVNAFTLFSAQFKTQYSKHEIKAMWETVEAEEKKKLMKEARALNNIHRINRGEPKARRPMSGYTMFTKEMMNQGLKMVDIGVRWKALSQNDKDEYKAKADAANRDRTPSNHDPPTQS